jgi:metallo-beta-lactamase family protein
MCTGGRIKHHLKYNISRKETAIIFVGYQAKGTLGRHIVEGKEKVKIFGKSYRVRATVHTIGGFSAHADKAILVDWLQHAGKPEHVFLVHGEATALSSFDKELQNIHFAKEIHVPGMNSQYSL